MDVNVANSSGAKFAQQRALIHQLAPAGGQLKRAKGYDKIPVADQIAALQAGMQIEIHLGGIIA